MIGKRIKVFFDVSIGTKINGRIEFELFYDTTPITADNFKCLCTGEKGNSRRTGKPLYYLGSKIFRVIKGFAVQGGDIIHDNGDGGDCIFPEGKFRDENFNRRHAQAGTLSMANVGRHSNTSQFFITLKALPQLDNKHVVFGQVTQGMDIIRAMENIPTDARYAPKVPIIIVGCGVIGAPSISRNPLIAEQKAAVDSLMETLDKPKIPDEIEEDDPNVYNKRVQKKSLYVRTTAAQMARDKLQEINDEKEEEKDSNITKNDEEEVSESLTNISEVPLDNKQKRLLEIRLKVNQSRALNNKEIINEKKKHSGITTDPSTEKKKFKMPDSSESITNDSEREYLQVSAHAVELRKQKLRKKKESFGWNVFTNDAAHKLHKKRLYDLPDSTTLYDKQKNGMGETFFDKNEVLTGKSFQPNEEAKDRLAEHVDKVIKKRGNFSRRRTDYEMQDVTYINERNRLYNKKLDRAFRLESMEIKQNLERGTAL